MRRIKESQENTEIIKENMLTKRKVCGKMKKVKNPKLTNKGEKEK